MRILVTGANGYLGQGIVKAIIESGNKVIAMEELGLFRVFFYAI